MARRLLIAGDLGRRVRARVEEEASRSSERRAVVWWKLEGRERLPTVTR